MATNFLSNVFTLVLLVLMSLSGWAQQIPRAGEPQRIDDGTGPALMFAGDATGDGPADVISYNILARTWFLRSYQNGSLAPIMVGNTNGFGNLADGRPIWSADWNADGRGDILFYSPPDHNWWLGTLNGQQLAWSLIGNTAAFGQVGDGRPIYIGRFSRADRFQVLFYYPGDSNWWLGTFDGSRLQWELAGNTKGFGNLANGQRFFIDDFDGDGLANVMFYSPLDANWWMGTFRGSQLSWRLIGNTRGFGNLADGRPMWSADVMAKGKAAVIFHYPGDRNWWVGYLGASLTWTLVGNTTGFGNIADGRPIYTGRFSQTGQDEFLFFSPGDNNWWLGSITGGQLRWRLSGNTAGFGAGFPQQVKSHTIIGGIAGPLANVLYFSAFDRHTWLGSLSGGTLSWALVDSADPTPPATGYVTPKYMVVSVIYAPPGTAGNGARSSVGYEQSAKLGTNVTAANSFKTGTKLSLDLAAGFTIGGGFNAAVNSTNQNSTDVSVTTTSAVRYSGPGRNGIDHDQDVIKLWLKPRVNLRTLGTEIKWSLTPNGQVVDVFAGELKNPATMRSNVATALSEAGITTGDFARILSQDPLAVGVAMDPQRFARLNLTLPYEAPNEPNGSIPAYTYTLSSNAAVTTTNSVEYSYGATLSAGVDIALNESLKAAIKSTTDWTWTNKTSASTTNSAISTATLTITGASFGYSDAIDMAVFWDSLYKAFVFVPVGTGGGSGQQKPADSNLVSGLVVDPVGKAMIRVEVSLRDGKGTHHSTLTDSKGAFRFFDAVAGDGHLSAPGADLDITVKPGSSYYILPVKSPVAP